jgi:hypothetical protein
VTSPAGTEQHTLPEEHPADADTTTLQVHLAACIQAAHNHDWGLLRDSARQLAEAADRLDVDARPGNRTRPDDGRYAPGAPSTRAGPGSTWPAT